MMPTWLNSLVERVANILIVYDVRHPLRASQRDHLLSFEKHPAGHRCFYLNTSFRTVSRALRNVSFDLIIFHWSFLGVRMSGPSDRLRFQRLMEKVRPLCDLDAVKIGMPQDEFVNMDLLVEFIEEFKLDHLFSVAPPSQWPALYRGVDFERTRFHRLLTGYLANETVVHINALARSEPNRRLDIGYRSGSSAGWGRHSLYKQHLADRFGTAAAARGLKLDVKAGWENFLMGDEWLRFLLRCKYTLGVEGGASILDWDGTVWARMREFQTLNPMASYDEIEAACFPGRDGEIQLVALSPRHLEACATRTCQVLIEGEYNGVLRPHEHYIPLKPDFSNLEEVLDQMERDDLRAGITERAYQDIVASGHYRYETMVDTVFSTALTSAASCSDAGDIRTRAMHQATRLADTLSWQQVRTLHLGRSGRNLLRTRRGGSP